MTAPVLDDRALLYKIIESLAETKTMLKMALERADKVDGHIESLRTRVDDLEKNEARQSGRAALIGTGFGTIAASGVTLVTMFVRDKLGF